MLANDTKLASMAVVPGYGPRSRSATDQMKLTFSPKLFTAVPLSLFPVLFQPLVDGLPVEPPFFAQLLTGDLASLG